MSSNPNGTPAPDGAPITRSELRSEISAALAAAVKELREYIDERTHDAETRLLRAFADYQEAETTRFRH